MYQEDNIIIFNLQIINMVSFEAYKFDHVYEFADIIYKMVEDETMFWAYDNTRYRNRRLGEYLKELELTEGRSTGIPTIQNVLKANGSPRAIVVTDEERTFFRITIPCHEAAGNIIADIANKDNRDPKDDPKGDLKELSERQSLMLDLIKSDDLITIHQMTQKINVSEKTIKRELAFLQEKGILTREGGRKEGKWVILIEE